MSVSIQVVVSGVVSAEGWSARREWTWEAFAESVALKDLRLKCGEDDDGKTIRLALGDFAQYCAANRDDSPLYIFDSGFSDRKGANALLRGFSVPKFAAKHDLFEMVGEKRRPPYRWVLLGPERSGTCAHVDPLGTSAWNTVVSGRKRWVLFEPGTSKSVVKGSKLYDSREMDDEAVNYFVDILPRIRAAHPHARRIEFVQNPGETVFVPGGWWHAVINLDASIGATQNFASRANFDAVWHQTRAPLRARNTRFENSPKVGFKSRRFSRFLGLNVCARSRKCGLVALRNTLDRLRQTTSLDQSSQKRTEFSTKFLWGQARVARRWRASSSRSSAPTQTQTAANSAARKRRVGLFLDA